MSPLYFAVFSAVGALRQVIFWEPSATKSSSLSRAWGGGGVAGSLDSQVTCHQQVSATHCIAMSF